ncbi:DUF3040 domain-containing protein [Saccharomonospora sp. NPDC046836]|uniref:DUF3040 domain-containing protein n=1 Tax=Saccharomonospora sp. NPDC046836 TaxID=3156921 RepID=UPI0033E64ED1
MPLSEKEQHALDALERTLRTENPRLDRWLRRMRSPEDTTSVVLTLGILAAIVLGVALLIVGTRLGEAGWIAAGVIVTALVPAGAILWASKRYYHPRCHHLVRVSVEDCPRCTAVA